MSHYLLRYNGDDITDYARESCLNGRTLSFDNIGELDRRTRYAGGKIDPKHTFIGQSVGGLFGMKKVVKSNTLLKSCAIAIQSQLCCFQ